MLYVGTAQTIYKSRDGGESWVVSDQGMGGVRVMSLALDPRSTAQVYAGTFGEAVWKSWDGGQHWIPDNLGLKEHISIVNAIIFDVQDPGMMYLASTVGIYKRTAPDVAWVERVEGMESVYAVTLVADPKRPGTLYTGTSGGVYKSVNRAEHWKPINTGLGIEARGGALSHGVNALVLHPEETTTLYIGTTRGLFVSTDGGASWTQSRTIPGGNIAALAINPREPSIIYAGGAGIFKTTDGGATWTSANTGLTNQTVRVLEMDPQEPQTLYVGTNGGLFKTTDGGQTWKQKKLEG
jgi:photosystem II stability/assembly factor-like uncharacterized protein